MTEVLDLAYIYSHALFWREMWEYDEEGRSQQNGQEKATLYWLPSFKSKSHAFDFKNLGLTQVNNLKLGPTKVFG